MGMVKLTLICILIAPISPIIVVLLLNSSTIFHWIRVREGTYTWSKQLGTLNKKKQKKIESRFKHLNRLGRWGLEGLWDWHFNKKYTFFTILNILAYLSILFSLFIHSPTKKVFQILALNLMYYPFFFSLYNIFAINSLWRFIRKTLICPKCGKRMITYSEDVEVFKQNYDFDSKRNPGWYEKERMTDFTCPDCKN